MPRNLACDAAKTLAGRFAAPAGAHHRIAAYQRRQKHRVAGVATVAAVGIGIAKAEDGVGNSGLRQQHGHQGRQRDKLYATV